MRQADASIAQAVWREQRGKTYRAEDAHDKLDNASLKGGSAVAHALDRSAENHQQADGTVRIPEKLQPYMGGRKFIGKNAR